MKKHEDLGKLEGVSIMIGAKEWIVPSLNMAEARMMRPQFKILTSIPAGTRLTEAQLDALVTIIHTVLLRNYPDLTKDALETMLTLANVEQVFGAVMAFGAVMPLGGLPANQN